MLALAMLLLLSELQAPASHRASMTSPILATSLPRNVEPGSQAALRFKLDTSSLEGPFDGQILLFLNDPETPEVRLAFEGEVVRSFPDTVDLGDLPLRAIQADPGLLQRSAHEL
jgi:hypothetical protein